MPAEKKTLIILTPGFAASEADSNCLPMQQNLLKALKQNNPELHIIILAFQYPYLVQKYTWFDITVMSFNGQNKGGLSRLLLRRKIMKALKEINSSSKTAGILSFWYNECAWVGKKFAEKNGLKHFCWILGQDARPTNKYPEALKLQAGELIALSDSLQDEFNSNHGISPAHVIPPGVANEHFAAEAQVKEIDLLAAGSLIPLKQFEIFIEVVVEIKKQIPGVKAVLIGDGPEKKKLNTLIEKLGLHSNIILTGELQYPEVLKWMQRSKVFLHPSSYEGFSGVCQEALAAGAYVISFCKPMKQDIENWSIVTSQAEMKNLSLYILQDKNIHFRTVTPFLLQDTIKKIVELFKV